MLLIGPLVGLVVGLAAGGRLDDLLGVRLRYLALLVVALVLRFATQWLIADGVTIVDDLRLALYALSFGLVAAVLWLNRSQPGLLLVMVGVIANGIAIVANGGWMPVHGPALEVAGLTPADLSPTYHRLLDGTLDLGFLLRAGPLGDLVPLPVPGFPTLVSMGDVAITVGLGWFVAATMVRAEPSREPGVISLWRGGPAQEPSDEAAQPSMDDRPVMLGGGHGPGLRAPDPGGELAPGEPDAVGWQARVRAHPYVRLLRDARFSAFWLGQAISMFGDRLHQLALGALVLTTTGSPVATGLVFLLAVLPNLFLGPIAGTFVDRWDQKRVMIASDLIRAVLVLLVPFVAEIDILLVYPMVLLLTSVSLFFRPARAAVVPRIVPPEDLLAANSALWTAESVADVVGYPIAGVFVAMAGSQVALAFWVDAATYVASAVLIMALVVPPAARVAAPRFTGAVRAFVDELASGWAVMRREAVLLQNTLVSAVAQLCIGAMVTLTYVYTTQSFGDRFLGPVQDWAAIEAAIGVGNLVGGVAVGLIGARRGKGRMVVAGIISMGLAVTILGLTTDFPVALLAAGIIGIANLVYVVPTQTIFGEVTPEGYLGRVVAIRSSIVMGAMAFAMGICTVLVAFVPAGPLIAATGMLAVLAGVVGALLPAVRDA